MSQYSSCERLDKRTKTWLFTCGKEEKYKSILTCMNPLNHGFKKHPVWVTLVFTFQPKCLCRYFSPLDKHFHFTMCWRGWDILMHFSTTCELLSEKCSFNHPNRPLLEHRFSSVGSKGHVCGMWLVDFHPFCLFVLWQFWLTEAKNVTYG